MSQSGSFQEGIPVFTVSVSTTEASITKGSELKSLSPTNRVIISSGSFTATEQSPLCPSNDSEITYYLALPTSTLNGSEIPETKQAQGDPLLDRIEAELAADPLFVDLANFVVFARPITNCCWKGFKYSILTIASGTCIFLYIPGALAYGRSRGDAETGQQLAGNTLPSAVVMLNASHHFINFKEDVWCVDQALGKWIDQSLAKMEPWETVLASLISAISAFPLSIPAYELNSDYSEPVRYTMAGIVQFDYTLNHTLAMWILLNFPLTRKILLAPFLPFYYTGKGIYYCRLTENEKYAKALEEQVAYDHHQIKLAMVETFNNAIDNILKNSVTLNFQAWKNNSWQEKFRQSIFEVDRTNLIHLQNKTAIGQYVGLLALGAELAKPHPPTRLDTCYQKYVKPCLSSVNTGVSKFMWLAGAVGMTVGIAGFIEDTRKRLEIWTGSEAGSFELTAPTFFTSAIITSYFGGSTAQNSYDNLIAWVTGDGQVPLAVKLYPKTVTLALLISGYLSWFASGTAEVLVEESFSPGLLRDVLVGSARYGIQIFTFRNMFDIIFKAVEIHALKWGSDDEKAVFRLKDEAEFFSRAVTRFDGKKLQDSFSSKTPQCRRMLLGKKASEFNQLTKHEENLEAKLVVNQQSWFRNRFLPLPRGTTPVTKLSAFTQDTVLATGNVSFPAPA